MQYGLDGKYGFDPDLFLLNVKQSMTNLLIDRQQTTVKLILSCMMKKVDPKSGEVIAKEAEFHYKTEVNSNELFSKMKETVLESSANFKDKEVIGDSVQF